MGRKLAALLACTMVLASVTDGMAAPGKPKRARVAAAFLVEQQDQDGSFPAFSPVGSTADAVVSLAAVRRGRTAVRRALRFLRSQEAEVDSVGEKAKVILALVATGASAREFSGRDLVEEIRTSEEPDGRYGADTAVFDQSLAVLALTGAEASVSEPATQWLADAQCDDGGWQYDRPPTTGEDEHCAGGPEDFFSSDTDTTSLAVQALSTASSSASFEHDPFAFFRMRRDPEKRGWGYDRSFPLTNANSTSLVIQAYAAADRELPDGALRALIRLQHRLCGRDAGAFAFTYEDRDDDGDLERGEPNMGATIGAILGLLEQPLPVENARIRRGVPDPGRC